MQKFYVCLSVVLFAWNAHAGKFEVYDLLKACEAPLTGVNKVGIRESFSKFVKDKTAHLNPQILDAREGVLDRFDSWGKKLGALKAMNPEIWQSILRNQEEFEKLVVATTDMADLNRILLEGEAWAQDIERRLTAVQGFRDSAIADIQAFMKNAEPRLRERLEKYVGEVIAQIQSEAFTREEAEVLKNEAFKYMRDNEGKYNAEEEYRRIRELRVTMDSTEQEIENAFESLNRQFLDNGKALFTDPEVRAFAINEIQVLRRLKRKNQGLGLRLRWENDERAILAGVEGVRKTMRLRRTVRKLNGKSHYWDMALAQGFHGVEFWSREAVVRDAFQALPLAQTLFTSAENYEAPSDEARARQIQAREAYMVYLMMRYPLSFDITEKAGATADQLAKESFEQMRAMQPKSFKKAASKDDWYARWMTYQMAKDMQWFINSSAMVGTLQLDASQFAPQSSQGKLSDERVGQINDVVAKAQADAQKFWFDAGGDMVDDIDESIVPDIFTPTKN